jgi:uncharacterized membrane protein
MINIIAQLNFVMNDIIKMPLTKDNWRSDIQNQIYYLFKRITIIFQSAIYQRPNTLPSSHYIICPINGTPNTLNQIQSGASRRG